MSIATPTIIKSDVPPKNNAQPCWTPINLTINAGNTAIKARKIEPGKVICDIILSKYPNEGGSTYRMEVYHNNDGVATGTSGGFAIENGNVYFDFKFKDGKVIDYSFDEQKY